MTASNRSNFYYQNIYVDIFQPKFFFVSSLPIFLLFLATYFPNSPSYLMDDDFSSLYTHTRYIMCSYLFDIFGIPLVLFYTGSFSSLSIAPMSPNAHPHYAFGFILSPHTHTKKIIYGLDVLSAVDSVVDFVIWQKKNNK